MTELKVEKSEKVACCSFDWKTEKYGPILEIFTVVSISIKGTITVKNKWDKFQYTKDGYGKGTARSSIRKLEIGEEETFLAKKEAENQLDKERRDKKEKEYQEEVHICYLWVLRNSPEVKIIETLNTMLYIVDLPIPKFPSSIVISFQHKYLEDDGTHYSAYIWMFENRGNYMIRGTTTYDVNGQNPHEVAAMWLRTNFGIEKLKEEEEKENAASE